MGGRQPSEDVIADKTQQKNPATGGEGYDYVEPRRKRHRQGDDDDCREQQQNRAVNIYGVYAVFVGIEFPVPVDEHQEDYYQCGEYSGQAHSC